QGSFEAVIKVTTGTANLGTTPPSSREREAARMTPGLYYLMPSFAEGLTVAPGLPNSLFDPGLWQTTIIDTIAEYIRLHGLDPDRAKADRRAAAAKIFADMLRMARQHRTNVERLDLGKAGLTAKSWLCVVGVDATTRVRLEVVKNGQEPEFAFRTADRMDEWGKPPPADPKLTGDGTVPFAGAVPPFLPYQSLVCVTPSDYGYWEIGDVALTEVGGFHGILPNMNMLHRMIVRFFADLPDTRKNTWGRPPPGVTEAQWDPPLKLSPP
ncbi:MAG TPA: hypothetical protein VFB16_10010, partial [Bauldia sp.]|nr:hypothetical protein [Bauldia sp.]